MATTQSQEPAAGKPRRKPRETARSGAMVVLAVLITLFAVFNLDQVKVNWVVGSGRAPLIIVIVISLLVGIALTYFVDRRSRRSPNGERSSPRS